MQDPYYVDPLSTPPVNPFGVLFLDIDGVICTDRTYYAYAQDKTKSILRTWDPISIKLVNRLCMDYNLEVVVSSSWRQIHDVPLILLTHGFQGNFHKDEKTPQRMSSNTRGCQIHEWLDNHPDINNFIILDDEADGIMDSNLQPFHIQTDHENGFLTSNWRQARRVMDLQRRGLLKFDRDDRWLDDTEKRDAYLRQV